MLAEVDAHEQRSKIPHFVVVLHLLDRRTAYTEVIQQRESSGEARFCAEVGGDGLFFFFPVISRLRLPPQERRA